ncbi:MAG: hypothetical protein ABR548_04965 [Actinomycetota bacterium]|nr:hypothetical protein [Actinomycetota bacterium]
MGFRKYGFIPLLAALLIAAPLSVPAAQRLVSVAPDAAFACPSYSSVTGIGPACREPNGLLRVRLADGSTMTTHGPDSYTVAGGGGSASAPARQPKCVSGGSGYYIVPIYARAIDDTDQFSSRVSTIRGVLKVGDGLVAQAAAAGHVATDMRMLCSNGVIDVQNVTLPTPKSQTDFASITSDLRNLGYNNLQLKYWVFYDDKTACGCAGMAATTDDDRLAADNLNNGNSSGAMFAVTFNTLTASTMLHELAHTMGAVQLSAPHTTGAGHCTDGRDILCYNDGGRYGRRFTTSRCSSEIVDCGKDDYFNARPRSGTYLSNHWNLGSRLNRYLQFDTKSAAPVMKALVCPSKAGIRNSFQCGFAATDDSSGVAYVVNWGDRTRARFPRTGWAQPGQGVAGTHVYSKVATVRVTVYAIDSSSPSQRSAGKAVSVHVLRDIVPPTMTLIDPSFGTFYKGCQVKVPYEAATAVVAQKVCISANVTDDASGVGGLWVFINGTLKGIWYKNTGKFRIEVPVHGPAMGVSIRIIATDLAGNRTEKTISVNVLQ